MWRYARQSPQPCSFAFIWCTRDNSTLIRVDDLHQHASGCSLSMDRLLYFRTASSDAQHAVVGLSEMAMVMHSQEDLLVAIRVGEGSSNAFMLHAPPKIPVRDSTPTQRSGFPEPYSTILRAHRPAFTHFVLMKWRWGSIHNPSVPAMQDDRSRNLQKTWQHGGIERIPQEREENWLEVGRGHWWNCLQRMALPLPTRKLVRTLLWRSEVAYSVMNLWWVKDWLSYTQFDKGWLHKELDKQL